MRGLLRRFECERNGRKEMGSSVKVIRVAIMHYDGNA